MLLLALAGCSRVVDDRHVTVREEDARTYVVEADVETEPGQHEVRAAAVCDEGDRVIAGGCAWGDVVDPHDQPLRPLADRPTPDGLSWECLGQNTGVGSSLKTLTASAVCEETP